MNLPAAELRGDSLISELQEKYFQSLIIILLISMSDIIDGIVAKQAESNCKGGDIFDIAADFMVVLSVFVLWYLKQRVCQGTVL